MKIINATWYDDYNSPFLTEHYESSVDHEKLLNFFAEQKSVYGRTVIANYPNTRVFSDGTRVIVQLFNVKQEIGSEENFEIEEPLDVETIKRQPLLDPPGDF